LRIEQVWLSLKAWRVEINGIPTSYAALARTDDGN
jgi:hypothetical protein